MDELILDLSQKNIKREIGLKTIKMFSGELFYDGNAVEEFFFITKPRFINNNFKTEFYEMICQVGMLKPTSSEYDLEKFKLTLKVVFVNENSIQKFDLVK